MKEHIETNNGKNTDLLFHFLKEEFACSEKSVLDINQNDEDIDRIVKYKTLLIELLPNKN